MEKSIITTGKSIELAIEAALKQLKLDRDSVSVEVLENARSGFLGIGASPAKVKVTYEVADEPKAPRSALGSAPRTHHEPSVQVQTTVSSVISRPGKKPQETEQPREASRSRNENKGRDSQRKKNPDRKSQEKKNTDRKTQEKAPQEKLPQEKLPQERKKPEEKREQPAPRPQEPRTYVPAAPGSVEEEIETFLKGLLEHMGSEAVPHAYQLDENSYRADLVGSDAGPLIGRRGDTLDAIQYLTGYAVNRTRENRLRISVDAGDYRLKREEALRQLARKMAGKAVKYRRNFTLEPMNAYERHIIHAALQDYPEVTTFSTGAEPHRRIVVAYAREK